jgi:hypothetical protein
VSIIFNNFICEELNKTKFNVWLGSRDRIQNNQAKKTIRSGGSLASRKFFKRLEMYFYAKSSTLK